MMDDLSTAIARGYDRAIAGRPSPHIDRVTDQVYPIVQLAYGLRHTWSRDDVRREILNAISAIHAALADPQRWGEWDPNRVVRFGPIAVQRSAINPTENFEIFVSAAEVYGMHMIETPHP